MEVAYSDERSGERAFVQEFVDFLAGGFQWLSEDMFGAYLSGNWKIQSTYGGNAHNVPKILPLTTLLLTFHATIDIGTTRNVSLHK